MVSNDLECLKAASLKQLHLLRRLLMKLKIVFVFFSLMPPFSSVPERSNYL